MHPEGRSSTRRAIQGELCSRHLHKHASKEMSTTGADGLTASILKLRLWAPEIKSPPGQTPAVGDQVRSPEMPEGVFPKSSLSLFPGQDGGE